MCSWMWSFVCFYILNCCFPEIYSLQLHFHIELCSYLSLFTFNDIIMYLLSYFISPSFLLVSLEIYSFSKAFAEGGNLYYKNRGEKYNNYNLFANYDGDRKSDCNFIISIKRNCVVVTPASKKLINNTVH